MLQEPWQGPYKDLAERHKDLAGTFWGPGRDLIRALHRGLRTLQGPNKDLCRDIANIYFKTASTSGLSVVLLNGRKERKGKT